MEKYNKLLEDNVICKELKEDEEYQKERVQADIIFYLLKKVIPIEDLKLLMKYDEVITSIHTKENKKWFEEGTKLGL
jgi:hypothetical protein